MSTRVPNADWLTASHLSLIGRRPRYGSRCVSIHPYSCLHLDITLKSYESGEVTQARPSPQPGWSCACGAVTGVYPGMYYHLPPTTSVSFQGCFVILCSQCRPSMLVNDDLLKVFRCSRHKQGDQQSLLEPQGFPTGTQVQSQPPLTPTKARASGDNRLQVLCSAFKSLRVLRRLQPLFQVW